MPARSQVSHRGLRLRRAADPSSPTRPSSVISRFGVRERRPGLASRPASTRKPFAGHLLLDLQDPLAIAPRRAARRRRPSDMRSRSSRGSLRPRPSSTRRRRPPSVKRRHAPPFGREGDFVDARLIRSVEIAGSRPALAAATISAPSVGSPSTCQRPSRVARAGRPTRARRARQQLARRPVASTRRTRRR